jgi:hypothetical protein
VPDDRLESPQRIEVRELLLSFLPIILNLARALCHSPYYNPSQQDASVASAESIVEAGIQGLLLAPIGRPATALIYESAFEANRLITG